MAQSELLLGVIEAGTRILSQRVLTIIALVMTMGLFCWAMALGSVIALICASIFALAVFLPVLWRDTRSSG